MSKLAENKELQQNTPIADELENEVLTAKVNWYEEQMSFINDAEINARPDLEEPKRETKEDFKDLRVETVTYDLGEEEKDCPACGSSVHIMTQEVRKEIGYRLFREA